MVRLFQVEEAGTRMTYLSLVLAVIIILVLIVLLVEEPIPFGAGR